MKMTLIRSGLAISLCAAVVSCGGGGADPAVAPPVPSPVPAGMPVGLKSRPVLKGLTFPADAPSSSSVVFSKAYPNLQFSSPLLFLQAPNSSAQSYVVTQGGQVFRFANDPAVNTSSVFLDLTDRTRANGEQGLLGFAFDPNYASNRYVYAYYSANHNPDTDTGNATVVRFTASSDGTTVDAATGMQLFNEPDPYNNHNGGSLLFGPDGYLYLALGDGGSGGDPQNNAQNLNSILGKILRLKSDGTIPADNPFAGQSGKRGDIWAYGLRNPYRVNFDRATGDLWVGDVGQDKYEEIDIVTKGGNYGWRVREGFHDYNTSDPKPNPAPIDPIFEYPHDSGQCSITGGVVYRGSAVNALAGRYIYGDFCTGTIWALTRDNGAVKSNVVIGSAPNPSSFGEDLAGELYVTAYDGYVYKMVNNPAGTGASFPSKLSQTGLFTDTAQLTPNAGLVEYELNAPFYSDGARKRRWFGIPDTAPITFSPDAAYDLPVGSATVKHFEISNADGTTRRLETRVFLHQSGGWQGYTYKWNAAGTDADLLDAAQTETITVRTDSGTTRTQDYEYPSRTACLGCHTAAAGVPLGVRTAQFNRSHAFPDATENQLTAYNRVSLFDRDIGAASQYAVQTTPTDTTASLAARARSYLDVNCSQCHRPGGPTGLDMDLRRTTAVAATRTVGVAPSSGDLGISGAQRIFAGAKEKSVLWERLRRLDSNRMPPLASHVVDDAGVALVGQWIDAGAKD